MINQITNYEENKKMANYIIPDHDLINEIKKTKKDLEKKNKWQPTNTPYSKSPR